jgi:sec-independent protein translocase protein TatB
MFDISWSELLILGLVTLIFVGPKELPRFLGTLGRYMGVVRRQANEFRAVFEQAMREAEMDQIQKEIRSVSDGVKASLDDATRSVESAKAAAKVEPASAPKKLAEPPAASEPQSSADATNAVSGPVDAHAVADAVVDANDAGAATGEQTHVGSQEPSDGGIVTADVGSEASKSTAGPA